jgi:hypothetical protein
MVGAKLLILSRRSRELICAVAAIALLALMFLDFRIPARWEGLILIDEHVLSDRSVMSQLSLGLSSFAAVKFVTLDANGIPSEQTGWQKTTDLARKSWKHDALQLSKVPRGTISIRDLDQLFDWLTFPGTESAFVIVDSASGDKFVNRSLSKEVTKQNVLRSLHGRPLFLVGLSDETEASVELLPRFPALGEGTLYSSRATFDLIVPESWIKRGDSSSVKIAIKQGSATTCDETGFNGIGTAYDRGRVLIGPFTPACRGSIAAGAVSVIAQFTDVYGRTRRVNRFLTVDPPSMGLFFSDEDEVWRSREFPQWKTLIDNVKGVEGPTALGLLASYFDQASCGGRGERPDPQRFPAVAFQGLPASGIDLSLKAFERFDSIVLINPDSRTWLKLKDGAEGIRKLLEQGHNFAVVMPPGGAGVPWGDSTAAHERSTDMRLEPLVLVSLDLSRPTFYQRPFGNDGKSSFGTPVLDRQVEAVDALWRTLQVSDDAPVTGIARKEWAGVGDKCTHGGRTVEREWTSSYAVGHSWTIVGLPQVTSHVAACAEERDAITRLSESGPITDLVRSDLATLSPNLRLSDSLIKEDKAVSALLSQSQHRSTHIVLFANDLPVLRRIPERVELDVITSERPKPATLDKAVTTSNEVLALKNLAVLKERGVKIHVVAMKPLLKDLAKGYAAALNPGEAWVDVTAWCAEIKRDNSNVTCYSVPVGAAPSDRQAIDEVMVRIASTVRRDAKALMGNGRAESALNDRRFAVDGDATGMPTYSPQEEVPVPAIVRPIHSNHLTPVRSVADLVWYAGMSVGNGTWSVIGTSPTEPLNWLGDSGNWGVCWRPQENVRRSRETRGLGLQWLGTVTLGQTRGIGRGRSLGPTAIVRSDQPGSIRVRLPSAEASSAPELLLSSTGEVIAKGEWTGDDEVSASAVYSLKIPGEVGGVSYLRLGSGRTITLDTTAAVMDGAQDGPLRDASMFGQTRSLAIASGGAVISQIATLKDLRPSFPIAQGMLVGFFVALLCFFSPLVQPWPWLAQRLWTRHKFQSLVEGARTGVRISLDEEAAITDAGMALGTVVGRKVVGDAAGLRPLQSGDSLRVARTSDLLGFMPWGTALGLIPRRPQVRVKRALQTPRVAILWDVGYPTVFIGTPNARFKQYAVVRAAYVSARLATAAGVECSVMPLQRGNQQPIALSRTSSVWDLWELWLRQSKRRVGASTKWRSTNELDDAAFVVAVGVQPANRWTDLAQWFRSLQAAGKSGVVIAIVDDGEADLSGLVYDPITGTIVDRSEFLGFGAAQVLKAHETEIQAWAERQHVPLVIQRSMAFSTDTLIRTLTQVLDS